MKNVIVASHKLELGLFLAASFIGLQAAPYLLPESYSRYLAPLWWLWLIGLCWLIWSIAAPLLLVKRVNLEPAIEQGFQNFEKSIEQLGKEEVDLSRAIQDAQTFNDALIGVLIGFIQKANELKIRQEALQTRNLGKIAFHDGKLSELFSTLDDEKREDTLDKELGILSEWERGLLVQAEALRGRIIAARGQIAQQRLKLERTQAATPLLQMDNRLLDCQKALPLLGEILPASGTIGRIISHSQKLLQ